MRLSSQSFGVLALVIAVLGIAMFRDLSALEPDTPQPAASPPPPLPEEPAHAPAIEIPEDPLPSQIDCLLDPAGRGCEALRSPTKAAAESHGKLDARAVARAVNPLRAEARACNEHGALPEGAKVTVEMSVEGSTGAVLEIAPAEEHANTEVARCVSEVLREARFETFPSERHRFSLRLPL
ncbi:hypothetical protein PPSIR1_22996 [Plesiocystis pacifica SIR-1]|uniref:Uncharacterized protein n=1 Tax=Plesiocystis pacifica SIR-1 TaxID=391625 RepID=A6G2M2_9BACT|nr:hypothetical protein [Plesiocystis pacifica]EDM79959.1 hypothetical protein PPSIR1_22996 [Plesiocystis pacifica SIR-1]